MKKTLKLLSALSAAVLLLTAIFCMPVSAASATMSLSPSKKAFTVGETVTVSGTFNSDAGLYAFDGSITYDSSKVQYVSGGSNQESSVRFVDSGLSGETKVTYSATFKAIAEGSCYFKFSGDGSDGSSYISVPAQGATITISAATTSSSTPAESSSQVSSTVSSNANLKSLKVSGVTLSPAFSASKTGYTATVANTVESVKVTATAADSTATVSGTGTYPLEIGNNKLAVTVTAADGTTKKTYSISVKRQTADETVATPSEQETVEDITDPLAVTVSGKSYHIMQDISSVTLLAGFTLSSTAVNGTEVGVFQDENADYTIFCLTDDSDAEQTALFFTMDADGDFSPLHYIADNQKIYILEKPEYGLSAPDGFYETTVTINGYSVKAYAYEDEDMSDMYIVYCWCEGERDFYSYDKREGTIQRQPDFKLVEAVAADTEEPSGILGRFAAMSANGKIVIIIAVLAVLCLIALLVLLIIKFTRRAVPPPQIAGENELIFDNIETEGFLLEDEQNTEEPQDIVSDAENTEPSDESEDEF